MVDQKPAWRVNSGMMARLTGSFRRVSLPGEEQSHAPENQVPGILPFNETRELIFLACKYWFHTQSPVSLLVLNIDEFSCFENNFGRDAAGEAAKFIEQTLCHHRDLIFGAESPMVIGAYVDHRYLFLLPGVTGAVAEDFAEYLRKAIVSTPFTWNFQPLHFTVSIGISHKPGHAGDQDMLILQADSACDVMISHGGNRVATAKIT